MPKIIDHDNYRAELLEAVVAVFAEHGYRGLSVREIAAALGISTGALYHYFGGKQDLFLRVVERLTDDLADHIEAACHGRAPRERLEALLSHAADHEAWYARYNRLCLDYLRERDQRGARVMAATMDRSAAALASSLEIDVPAARFVLIALFGLVTERDLDGGATPFAEQAAFLLTWFDAHTASR